MMKTHGLKRVAKPKYFVIFVLLVCLLGVKFAFSCTIVVKANDEVVLVGNNEDYIEPRTKIWFFPSNGEDYGRVVWGFDRYMYPYQGGMNDQGLFVDINALNAFTGWRDDPEKQDFEGDEIEYILARLATVDEVVEHFQKHDIDLGYVKFVVADAQGNSVILEWLNDKLNILIRKRGFYAQ